MDVVGHLEKLDRPNTDVAFQFRFTKARDRTPENRSEFADVNIMLIDEKWEWKPAQQTQTKLKNISATAAKFLEVLSETISNGEMKLDGYPATYLDYWQRRCTKRGLLDGGKPASSGACSRNTKRSSWSPKECSSMATWCASSARPITNQQWNSTTDLNLQEPADALTFWFKSRG